MAWTESRSRDEWLAEVKRRGGRIRRRRQLTFALAGVLALVLPVTALATFLAPPDRGVEVSVAGPPPAGDVAPDTRVDAPSQPASPEEPTTTTTTAEVHERIAVGNGPVAPPADDPVLRRTTTTVPAALSSPPQSTTVPPAPTAPALVPCVASEFALKISVEKSAYRPGETVKGSSVLEKRSAGTCLMPEWWVEIGFVDAAGQDMSQRVHNSGSSSTANQGEKWVDTCRVGECRRPVEPGAVFTLTFEWETLDCTGPAPGPLVPAPGDTSWCVTFPSGAYAVVADWVGPESGPDARMTFQIGVA